jgi:hypothetical protein
MRINPQVPGFIVLSDPSFIKRTTALHLGPLYRDTRGSSTRINGKTDFFTWTARCKEDPAIQRSRPAYDSARTTFHAHDQFSVSR